MVSAIIGTIKEMFSKENPNNLADENSPVRNMVVGIFHFFKYIFIILAALVVIDVITMALIAINLSVASQGYNITTGCPLYNPQCVDSERLLCYEGQDRVCFAHGAFILFPSLIVLPLFFSLFFLFLIPFFTASDIKIKIVFVAFTHGFIYLIYWLLYLVDYSVKEKTYNMTTGCTLNMDGCYDRLSCYDYQFTACTIKSVILMIISLLAFSVISTICFSVPSLVNCCCKNITKECKESYRNAVILREKMDQTEESKSLIVNIYDKL